MSAAQTLALMKRLLPDITAREVSDAFAAAFDPRRAIFIAELPASDDVPGEADFLALGRAAVAVEPGKPANVARAATLLAARPREGVVVESVPHAASGVTSMWLDNGVRVHHRPMDQRKNEASIAITLAGGQIQETAANRGITEAALRAWERPATSTLSRDRKSTRLNSSHSQISYAVFCLKKKKIYMNIWQCETYWPDFSSYIVMIKPIWSL